MARGQRVWNRHPEGGASALGISPVRASRSRLVVRMRRQRGDEQRLGVGMQGVRAQLGAVGGLDDLAEVHHGDAVADVGDGGEIVADEQIAHAESPLQVLELGDDLRPDRHVERGDRLVEHDQPRVGRQRPGDGDPLALTAAELVREQVGHVRPQPHQFEHLRHTLAHGGTRERSV